MDFNRVCISRSEIIADIKGLMRQYSKRHKGDDIYYSDWHLDLLPNEGRLRIVLPVTNLTRVEREDLYCEL